MGKPTKNLFGLVITLTFLTASGIASASGSFKFSATASGEQEVWQDDGVMTDTTGSISIKFNGALSEVEFEVRVHDGIAITQAHLHCARAGVNGPVVVFLFNEAPLVGPGGVDVNGVLAEGTLTNVDIENDLDDFAADEACGVVINNIASLFAAMRDGKIYLNVHSEENPQGEVRAQIFPNR